MIGYGGMDVKDELKEEGVKEEFNIKDEPLDDGTPATRRRGLAVPVWPGVEAKRPKIVPRTPAEALLGSGSGPRQHVPSTPADAIGASARIVPQTPLNSGGGPGIPRTPGEALGLSGRAPGIPQTPLGAGGGGPRYAIPQTPQGAGGAPPGIPRTPAEALGFGRAAAPGIPRTPAEALGGAPPGIPRTPAEALGRAITPQTPAGTAPFTPRPGARHLPATPADAFRPAGGYGPRSMPQTPGTFMPGTPGVMGQQPFAPQTPGRSPGTPGVGGYQMAQFQGGNNPMTPAGKAPGTPVAGYQAPLGQPGTPAGRAPGTPMPGAAAAPGTPGQAPGTPGLRGGYAGLPAGHPMAAGVPEDRRKKAPVFSNGEDVPLLHAPRRKKDGKKPPPPFQTAAIPDHWKFPKAGRVIDKLTKVSTGDVLDFEVWKASRTRTDVRAIDKKVNSTAGAPPAAAKQLGLGETPRIGAGAAAGAETPVLPTKHEKWGGKETPAATPVPATGETPNLGAYGDVTPMVNMGIKDKVELKTPGLDALGVEKGEQSSKLGLQGGDETPMPGAPRPGDATPVVPVLPVDPTKMETPRVAGGETPVVGAMTPAVGAETPVVKQEAIAGDATPMIGGAAPGV
eukprot:TRINITY_DN80636_c0_g1_i1.p1 TRINITY_DN80636_c0_g1~~TRINITY_DN80636_c0_g1_i1.p1  ORF type:complete len:622 (+),score=120.90 TRINITY_DN80636_c0_g1_i1:151-2016(+)